MALERDITDNDAAASTDSLYALRQAIGLRSSAEASAKSEPTKPQPLRM